MADLDIHNIYSLRNWVSFLGGIIKVYFMLHYLR